MTDIIRANVYESDPLTWFVARATSEYETYYELPATLVEAYEAADASRRAAVEAIRTHIRERHLQPHDDW